MTGPRPAINGGTPADVRLSPLLTDRQVAELLAVKPDTVRRWAAAGDLPCVRLGRLLRFRQSDVAVWVASHVTPAPTRRLRRRPGSIRVS